jgi:hypothetical protein
MIEDDDSITKEYIVKVRRGCIGDEIFWIK